MTMNEGRNQAVRALHIVGGLEVTADLLFQQPSYTFNSTILGATPSLAVSGAGAVVLKRSLADLMPAVDALLAGKPDLSPAIGK